MDTNIEFKKIKTTERNLDLKPTKFSRIFLMDTTITILDDCILFGDLKINLEVKHASKSNNFLVFNTNKSLYLLDFNIKILYKFEGDEHDFIKSEFNGENLEILYSNGIYKSYKIGEILEGKEIEIRKEEKVRYFYKGGIINDNEVDKEVDDVLSTPFGDIFIKNDKMKFKGKEIENELHFGDNNDKIYYYFTYFKDFILLGSSNNSNLYLYDFNLNILDNEGEDAIYIQADEEHNELYIRGMDYNKGRLVLIDLKGSVVEYYVKINKESSDNEEDNDNICFKCKLLKIQGDKLKIEDYEIEEFKEITQNRNLIENRSFTENRNLTQNEIGKTHDTKIEKPSIKLSENPEGFSFIQFKKDLLSSDELREDQTFTDEEISILSKNDNETMNLEDNNNNLSDLKSSMTDIKNNLKDLKSNLTDKKSDPFSFSFNKENSKSDDISKIKDDVTKSVFRNEDVNNQSVFTANIKGDVTKSVFGNEDVNNQSYDITNIKDDVTKSVFGNEDVNNQSYDITNNQSDVTERPKSVFAESNQSIFGKPESVKNVFNKEVPLSPFSNKSSFHSNLSPPISSKPLHIQPTSFKSTSSQPTSSKPSLDSVDDIISAILSIKTNSVSVNNYKINNITDRLESQMYSSMSKLKRINDIKREIESNLLIMINNLNTFKKIDSKSIEDSMRYFDEVIERKTRHKTPLIYNSPIIEPDLRKINQLSTTLEEDLSKLNLNVLTQIKLEPVYLIDKIKIEYKEENKREGGFDNSERKEAEVKNKKEEVKDIKEQVKDKREQIEEGRPQTNTNFYVKNNPEKESNLQSSTQSNTQPTIQLSTQLNPLQPNTQPTIQSNPNSLQPNPLQPNNQPNNQPNPFQSNSSDIFNRVLGSSIPVIQKEDNKETNKPPSAFSKFASSHNLFK